MSVIILEDFKKNNRTYCKCQCECGEIFNARKDNIKSGHTTSCGCLSSKAGKNLLNQVFNHLTVIEKTKKRNIAGSIIWKCRCNCSNHSIIEVDTHSLISGLTQSCGCMISKGEELIAQLLSAENIPFEKQKTFDTCRYPDSNYPAKFDFYVNNEYIIEFDGIQHFQPIEFFNQTISHSSLLQKDAYKTQWCKENHIPIIRIPYTKLNNLTIEDLLIKEVE